MTSRRVGIRAAVAVGHSPQGVLELHQRSAGAGRSQRQRPAAENPLDVSK